MRRATVRAPGPVVGAEVPADERLPGDRDRVERRGRGTPRSGTRSGGRRAPCPRCGTRPPWSRAARRAATRCGPRAGSRRPPRPGCPRAGARSSRRRAAARTRTITTKTERRADLRDDGAPRGAGDAGVEPVDEDELDREVRDVRADRDEQAWCACPAPRGGSPRTRARSARTARRAARCAGTRRVRPDGVRTRP